MSMNMAMPQTFEQFLTQHMPGSDNAQRLIAQQAWNAALAIMNRERIEKIVSTYVVSPMLVDEFAHSIRKISV